MQVTSSNPYSSWSSPSYTPPPTGSTAPTMPGDSYSPSSPALTSMLANDPQLAQEWQSLSPAQQQEVEQLFDVLGGTSMPATGENPPTTGGSSPTYGQKDTYLPPSNSSPSYSAASSSPSAAVSSPSAAVSSSTGSVASSGEVFGDQNPGPNDPSITLKNTTDQTRYYFIEASNDPEHLGGQVLAVPPNSSATLNPGVGFNGAITDNGTNSTAACLGTRMEFNTSANGQVTYDADTQYGNTNATFGASNGQGPLEGDGDLLHYIDSGATGAPEDAAHKYSDTASQTVSSNKFTLTSTDYKPGTDGGNDYSAATDPNQIYGVAYATGNGQVIV